MKKSIFILFAAAIASVNSFAQEKQAIDNETRKTPEQRATNMTKRLTKELDLSADQQVKAMAIILKREQDRDKLMEQMKGEREKMKAQMKQDHEKVKAEFKEFLTSEQYKKFEAKTEEMKKKQEARRMERKDGKVRQGPPPPPGE